MNRTSTYQRLWGREQYSVLDSVNRGRLEKPGQAQKCRHIQKADLLESALSFIGVEHSCSLLAIHEPFQPPEVNPISYVLCFMDEGRTAFAHRKCVPRLKE